LENRIEKSEKSDCDLNGLNTDFFILNLLL